MQWSTTVLAVRLGSFETAGNYSLAISFTNLFYYLALFGIRNYQISDIEKRFSNGQYFAARILAAIVAVAFFGITAGVSALTKYTVACYTVYMMFKLGEAFTEGYFSLLQVYGKYRRLAYSYMIKGVLPAVAFVVPLAVTHDLLTAVIWMTAGYWVCVLALDIPDLLAMKPGGPEFRGSTRVLLKCIPLMLVSMSVPAMNYITRDAIDVELNSYLLGQYSSLSSVVMVMGTFATVVFVVFVPKISELKQNGQWDALLRLCGCSLVVMLLLGGAAMAAGKILGRWVCRLVFGEAILENFELLIPLILTAVILMCKTFFASMLVPLNRRWSLLVGEASGVGLCELLARPLTRRFGMQGTNMSYMAGVGLQFLILAFSAMWVIFKSKRITENHQK